MDDLDAARHDAIRLLCAAQAGDRLTVDVFESRLALVKQAPNRATLDAILADLADLPTYTPPMGLVAAAGRAAPVAPAELLRLVSVFGSTKRAGSWTVPLRLELKIIFGEATIDLRDAVFGADYLEIDLSVTFGQLNLIVPAGAQVENECEERASSSTHSTRSARGANPLGLLIRITGRTLFSSIDIKEKRSSAEEALQPAWWQKLLPRG